MRFQRHALVLILARLTAELVFPVGGSAYQNQSPDARTLGKRLITPEALSISKGVRWRMLLWDTDFKRQMVQTWNFCAGGRTALGSTWKHTTLSTTRFRGKQAPAGATAAQRRQYPDFVTGSTSANSFGGLPPAALTNNASLTDRLRMVYANDSGQPKQSFSINGTYPLPFGKSKKFLAGAARAVDTLIGAWTSGALYYYWTGLFFRAVLQHYRVERGTHAWQDPGTTQGTAPGWPVV